MKHQLQDAKQHLNLKTRRESERESEREISESGKHVMHQNTATINLIILYQLEKSQNDICSTLQKKKIRAILCPTEAQIIANLFSEFHEICMTLKCN